MITKHNELHARIAELEAELENMTTQNNINVEVINELEDDLLDMTENRNLLQEIASELDSELKTAESELKAALANADHWMARKEELQRKLDDSLVLESIDKPDSLIDGLVVAGTNVDELYFIMLKGQYYRLPEVEK